MERRAATAVRALQGDARAHDGEHGGEGKEIGVLKGGEQEGEAQQQRDLDGIADVEAGEEAGGGQAECGAHGDAEHDGDGDAREGRGRRAAGLQKAGEHGEQDDDVHVIHRGGGEQKLRDALVRAPAGLHEAEHLGHDDGGRHRADDRAEHGGLEGGEAEQARGEQHHAQHLEGSGHEAHEHGGAADAPEVAQVEGEAGAHEDDDQRDAPDVGGDGQQ